MFFFQQCCKSIYHLQTHNILGSASYGHFIQFSQKKRILHFNANTILRYAAGTSAANTMQSDLAKITLQHSNN